MAKKRAKPLPLAIVITFIRSGGDFSDLYRLSKGKGWSKEKLELVFEAAEETIEQEKSKKLKKKQLRKTAREKKLEQELHIAKTREDAAETKAAAAVKEAQEERYKRLLWEGKTEEALGPEKYAQALKEFAELHFYELTPEDRLRQMQKYWHEIDAMPTVPGTSRYAQIMMWVQSKGFDPKEFWEEYRRRAK